ncbi:MAG: Smr/MutS family protein [Pyrinomonadaceae bacterium]
MRLIDWLRDTKDRADHSASSPFPSTSNDEVDPFNPFTEPVEIEITDIIDLHTIPPKDVKAVVIEYLHQARQAGFSSVRIIHGKGIGVQREIVRTVLAKSPFVAGWTDAPPEAGGLGATIALLSQSADYTD